MMLLRLLRPLLHMGIIMLSFWLMYLVRQTTDLIPFVQLRIPTLNLEETMLFALCAACAFVGIGIIRGMYELFRPLHKYYTVFLETWLIWTVVSSAIAYYGFGYVFVAGISRFVVVWGVLLSFVTITLRDRWRNALNNRLERREPYQILLIAKSETISTYVDGILSTYSIYDLEKVVLGDDEKHPGGQKYDILIVAGMFSPDLLQWYADMARIQ